MDRVHSLQLATLIIILIGLVVWVRWAWRNRRQWLYAVPPFTWLLHAAIFYSAVMIRDFYGLALVNEFTLWSAVLRMHAAFLLAGIGLVMLFERLVPRS